MGKPVPFYATRNDLVQLLHSVTSVGGLAITECGSFEHSEPITLPLQLAVHLGLSGTGNHITDKTYLIHDIAETMKMREIPQRNGGIRYCMDQQRNPQTIGLKAGGKFGENVVISGQLGQSTGNQRSEEMASLILQEMRRRFTKIKSYYVGTEAVMLLDSGGRLTINTAASPEYDLRR